MKVIESGLSKRKARQIAVPLTGKEQNELEHHLIETGLKKGAFVRQAILEKLSREQGR